MKYLITFILVVGIVATFSPPSAGDLDAWNNGTTATINVGVVNIGTTNVAGAIAGKASTTSPIFTTSLTITNAVTGTTPFTVNGVTGSSVNQLDINVNGVGKFDISATGIAQFRHQPGSTVTAFDVTGRCTLASSTLVVQDSSTVGANIFSTYPLSWSTDTFIYRDSAATVQLGADAATATAQTLKSHDGSGTDKAGANLTLEGGQGTGTGNPGGLAIRTASSSPTSASTANAYQDRARYVPKFVTLTDATATAIFTVTLPATNSIGMSFTCTVYAGDGTDTQSLSTIVTVDAVAKTTTITPVLAPTAAQTALAGSAGTLSVTYTVIDSGSNLLTVKCNADTSLTSTYLRAKIVMDAINIHGAGTVINEL